MDIYNIIQIGSLFDKTPAKYKIIKRGNNKATKTYSNVNEMQNHIPFYLFSRDCKIYLHNRNGSVNRIISSEASEL